MHSYVEVITTPTADTAGTAMLFDVGQKRYLFGNMHEGLQRACIQRNARLAKTTDIFIAGKTEWKNVGGLFGVILTMADANASAVQSEKENMEKKIKKKQSGEVQRLSESRSTKKAKYDDERAKVFREAGLDPEKWLTGPGKATEAPPTVPTLTIHGSKNLTHTIATARRFIFRKGMPIRINEHVAAQQPTLPGDGRDPDWKDESIQVWKLPIEPAIRDQSPKSPRKRLFDEFAAGLLPHAHHGDFPRNVVRTRKGSEAREDEQRRLVASEMFNSQWRVDALIETPLVQVPTSTPMWIRSQNTNKLERYYRPGDGTLPQINVLIRRPWPGALIEQLPPTQPSQTAMSYIVRHYSQRGKFLPDKSKALKVHHLLYQALQQGATIKSQDGTTVTPDMVLEPSRTGGGFAYLDVPSIDHLQDLLDRPEWKMPRIMNGLQIMIWNLAPDVASTAALQSFFSHHKDVKHIVAAPDVSANPISFESSAALVLRLNQIDWGRYLVPIYSNSVNLEALKKRLIDAEFPNPQSLSRGFRFQLEPSAKVLSDDPDLFFDVGAVLKDMPAEVLELANSAKSESSSNVSSENIGLPSQDAEIICLGTGSSAPSKYRNVSATLLRVPGCGSYLFDCGEGTLGQLKRLYTPTQMTELFRDLKAIWVSHLHADHHLGTTSVIKAWNEVNYGLDTANEDEIFRDEQAIKALQISKHCKRLFIFSEAQMIQWLKEYSSVEDFGYEKLVAVKTDRARNDPNSSSMSWNNAKVGFRTDNDAMNEAMSQATGIENLVTCGVNHCHGAQAVSVTFRTGFKFSYSGDCRPSKEFVRIGQGSTVLVHEATFDDDMQKDAEAKKHSTISEAIGVAQAMGAKRLVLTHFSQRYQKIPRLRALDKINVNFDDVEVSSYGEEAVDMPNGLEGIGTATVSPTPRQRRSTASPSIPSPESEELKIAVAFDFMRVRVRDIAYLDQLTPVLQRLFEIVEREDSKKAKDDPGEIARRKKDELKASRHKQSREQIRETNVVKAREKVEETRERLNKSRSRSRNGVRDGNATSAAGPGRRPSTAVAAPFKDAELMEEQSARIDYVDMAHELERVEGESNVQELGQSNGNTTSKVSLPLLEEPQVSPADIRPR
ncbi:MAG: hypothetical protein LQ341_001786 [Variospora aurantia]|nr:MAG: hypothetical protein LQ341_001786 [Variospora aurantia]